MIVSNKDSSVVCNLASYQRSDVWGQNVKYSISKLNIISTIRFAKWNVRVLLTPGKLRIIETELITYKIPICWLSETQCT